MKRILIVDDEPNNLQLLRGILSPEGYKLIFATDGEKALTAVNKHKPDIILLDVMMPNMDGYQVCTTLKNDPKFKNIPIIFVTAMGDVVDETKGFDLGCVDYILKPVRPSIVIARVKTHLSLVRSEQLKELSDTAIKMLGEAGHYNDSDTGEHIWRMASYSSAIAKHLGWDDEEIYKINAAASMHDTGKIGIPDSILKAPRKLTDEEWNIMRMHSQIGRKILNKSANPIFTTAAEIAYYHHEKWDGSGYPTGLSGEDIPLSARIVALADVFDALTMKRPYKEPWSDEDAFAEIEKSSGSHFDPKLVDVFLEIKDEIILIKDEWNK